MKIALTADPEIPVPPAYYGGIERIVYLLASELTAMGHEVTVFAHPDSKVPCKLVGWNGMTSRGIMDTFANTATLLLSVGTENFDVVHSFSRLAYLLPVLPVKQPKIMSYQREPSLNQISNAVRLSKKGSLVFTGCSDYITSKIRPVAEAVTVYNCVPLEKFTFSETVDDDAPLVFLGRIEPIKGAHLAVDAAIQSKRKLVMAGNIPEEGKNYFKELIEPFLNESITYIGSVNDTQKNEILQKACAILMPIQWNEPFGIVMAEAMACGTPVIGFPLGSVPEIVEDGVTGFLCRNISEMVEKIGWVKNINRSAVRRTAEERFSDKVITKQYLSLYNKMVNN